MSEPLRLHLSDSEIIVSEGVHAWTGHAGRVFKDGTDALIDKASNELASKYFSRCEMNRKGPFASMLEDMVENLESYELFLALARFKKQNRK